MRPRLLLLTPDYPPAPGGIQLMAHELARGLRGFETLVVAPMSGGASEFDANSGVRVRRARTEAWPGRARVLGLNGAALARSLRFRPHASLVMHIVASPAATVIGRLQHVRTVQYFHAKEIPDKPRLAAFAATRADAVIAVSGYTAGLIAATGAAPACMRLIPPGVTLPDSGSQARPVPAQHGGQPTVLTVSRLADRHKGHDVLIAALAQVRRRVPHVRWVVVGDGPLRGELEALARSRGVADITMFLGAVADEQRDDWLARADVLAMPSRLPRDGRGGDGFGIVYLEAAARETPVLAGNVGGALDAVCDGSTGVLVDPADPDAVAEGLTRLLLDPALARRLGQAGARRAREYAWPVIAARVEALLREVLAGR